MSRGPDPRHAGAGGDAYDKFQTAISAGSGAPDVMMVEADRIPTFQVQDALVDLTDLGYEDVKDNFSEGAWKDVSVGDAVYGAPVDGGPMGMIYRKDIFDQYGITPPTTWTEYEAAAQKVKDAGGPFFGDFPANQPAYVTHTARFVAQRRGQRYEELEAVVERNAARLFGW